jgi:DNA modification methylase
MVLGHSDYHYKHEPILYGWKPGAAHYFTDDRTKTSVLEFARPKANREHPTMKPLELWGELIKNSTKQGDRVLDTFCGSGTTLITCEQLNRVCHAIEIDPKYCQVIIERYRKHCAERNKPFMCKINGEEFKPNE